MNTTLIVDDDSIDRMVIIRALNKLQVCDICLQASSISAAQDIIASQKLDCIIVDMNINGLSGLDLIEWMRDEEICDDVPIVPISGAKSRGDNNKSISLGLGEILVKPMLGSDNEKFTDEIVSRYYRMSKGQNIERAASR